MADFADAMRWVLSGKKARRADWNRPAYVHLASYAELTAFIMVMRDGSFGPYTPSHCDMMAADWDLIAEWPC
jgi:hypothetical protein